MILIILIVAVGGYFISQIKTGVQKTEKVSTEVISFAGKEQLITAKVRSHINVEYGYNPQISVLGKTITMPNWGPGSRMVSADGPIDLQFGYDSLSQVFPAGLTVTKRELDDTVFVSITTPFVPPVMTMYSYQGFTKVSDSYFSDKDIDKKEFFDFIDSTSRAQCVRIVSTNQEFFMGTYAKALGSFVYNYEERQHPEQILVVSLNVGGKTWSGENIYTPEELVVPDEIVAKKIMMEKKAFGDDEETTE